MPSGGGFCGFPSGDALYEGKEGTVVELGGFPQESPAHMLVMGMTGAGKSVWLADYLSQSSGLIQFEAIVDEGQSLRPYAELQGLEVAVLRPEGTETLNYLDTQGQPLTSLHIKNAVGLLRTMMGNISGDRLSRRLISFLSKGLQQLYWDVFEDWCRSNPEKAARLLEDAFRLSQLPQTEGLTLTEQWIRFKEEAEKERKEVTPDEARLLAFSHSPKGRELMRSLAFTHFRPEDYSECTHTSLVQLLSLGGAGESDPSLGRELAFLLSPWTSEGEFGPLFDGITNLKANPRGLYFELGLIPESAPELKEAAVFLVANSIRNRILGLPRGQKKRMVFEEVKRFSQIPQGSRLLAEFLEQMRKVGCQTILTGQQFSQLEASGLSSTVSQNCRMFVLFRQNGRSDLDRLGEQIGLPIEAREEILTFATPRLEHLNAGTRAFLFMPAGHHPVCGSLLCRPSREMLYVAESSGRIFDERQALFRQSKDLFEAVILATQPESS